MFRFDLFLFILLRIFSNPIANVFQKKLSENISSVVINLYTYFILSIVVIPFFPHFFYVNCINLNLILLVLIAGFLCSLGTLCSIKAINIGELSVLGPINSYKSVIGLMAAFIFLNEKPDLLGIIGMILIIFGSRYIFEKEKQGFSFSLLKRRDIQLRFLSLFLTGIEAAILKKIILLSSVEMCFLFWCFSGFFWCLIFTCLSKKQFKINIKSQMPFIIFIALCLGIMQYSTNYVFNRMNVGYALSLFQLSSLVTVVLGYKVFHEQNLLRKLFGSFVMIIGSVLIFL